MSDERYKQALAERQAAAKSRQEAAVASPKGKAKVAATMHEYKHGELHSGSKKGPVVTNHRQAVAIALNQARRGTEGCDDSVGEASDNVMARWSPGQHMDHINALGEKGVQSMRDVEAKYTAMPYKVPSAILSEHQRHAAAIDGHLVKARNLLGPHGHRAVREAAVAQHQRLAEISRKYL
jgi:hypothetical protein